jgi:hypothetical protein
MAALRALCVAWLPSKAHIPNLAALRQRNCWYWRQVGDLMVDVAVCGSQMVSPGPAAQDGLVRYTHCTILAGGGVLLQGQFCLRAVVWLVQGAFCFSQCRACFAHQVARFTDVETEELPVHDAGSGQHDVLGFHVEFLKVAARVHTHVVQPTVSRWSHGSRQGVKVTCLGCCAKVSNGVQSLGLLY